MRLDLFLKLSRLEPRRPLAQKMCEAGAVAVNGVRAKSSHTVRVGDEVKVRRRERTITVRVAALPPKPPPKALASMMYSVVSEDAVSSEVEEQGQATFH